MVNRIRGALAGWKRQGIDKGVLLTLQVTSSKEAFADRQFDIVELALNERQLRSFTRDLIRASQEAGLTLQAPQRRWWQRLGR